MKNELKIALVFVLMIMLINNSIAQKWKVKSYLRIEKSQTYLTAFVKNTKELGNGYSFNTFVLLSDGVRIYAPWGEAVVGVGKKYHYWYFEGLVGFQ